MPGDWGDEQRRTRHYQDLGKPLEAQTLRGCAQGTPHHRADDSSTALLPRLSHLRIFRPKTKEERGLWALAKLEPQPEPQSLGLIKEAIRNRYGMLDLLDVFVEADRLVDFTRFFTHSGTKEVRSREELRPLLILDLFAEGTNTGIRRVANANDRYSYDELLYVRKTYFSPEALRNANGAVVNKLLALRNPRLWGEGASSCASDATALRELEAEPDDRVALALQGIRRDGLLARRDQRRLHLLAAEELLQLRGRRHDRGPHPPRHRDARREELRRLARPIGGGLCLLPPARHRAADAAPEAHQVRAALSAGEGDGRGLSESGRHVRPSHPLGSDRAAVRRDGQGDRGPQARHGDRGGDPEAVQLLQRHAPDLQGPGRGGQSGEEHLPLRLSGLAGDPARGPRGAQRGRELERDQRLHLLWPPGRAGHQQPRATGDRDAVAAIAAELPDAHQHDPGRADDRAGGACGSASAPRTSGP